MEPPSVTEPETHMEGSETSDSAATSAAIRDAAITSVNEPQSVNTTPENPSTEGNNRSGETVLVLQQQRTPDETPQRLRGEKKKDSGNSNASEKASRRSMFLKHKQRYQSNAARAANVRKLQVSGERSSRRIRENAQAAAARSSKETLQDGMNMKWKSRRAEILMEEGVSQVRRAVRKMKMMTKQAAPDRLPTQLARRSRPKRKSSSVQFGRLEIEDPLKLSALKFAQADEMEYESSEPFVNDAWALLCSDPDTKDSSRISLKNDDAKGENTSGANEESAHIPGDADRKRVATLSLSEANIRKEDGSSHQFIDPCKLQGAFRTMSEGMNKLLSSPQKKRVVKKPMSYADASPSTSPDTSSNRRLRSRVQGRGNNWPSVYFEDSGSDESFGEDLEEEEIEGDSNMSSSAEDVSKDEEWSPKKKTKSVSPKATTSKRGSKGKPGRKRTRNRQQYCHICKKGFVSIKRHMLMHNSTRAFKCEECGKAFFEKRVLDKHKVTHMDKFKCNVCGEQFSHVREARRHAKVHVAERPYGCELCHRQFRNRRELRKHMVVHCVSKQLICDICGHRCFRKSQLRAHQRSHTGERPYVCEVCGKAFRYSSGLRVHNFSHTTGKPYRCLLCNESFAHNYLLKRHRALHEAAAGTAVQVTCDPSSSNAIPNSTQPVTTQARTSPLPSKVDLPETTSYHYPFHYLSNYPMTTLTHSTPDLQMNPTAYPMHHIGMAKESFDASSTVPSIHPAPPEPRMVPPIPRLAPPETTLIPPETTLTPPQTTLTPPQPTLTPQHHDPNLPVSQIQPPVQQTPLLHSMPAPQMATFQQSRAPQPHPQNPPVPPLLPGSTSFLGDHLVRVNESSLIQTFLGPDMLKENLTYGPGSRQRTVESSLVVPLSSGNSKKQ